MRKGLFLIAAQNSIDEIEEYIYSLKRNSRKLSGSDKQELILAIDHLEIERDKLIKYYDELSNATEENFLSSLSTFKALSYKLKKRIDIFKL